MMSQHQMETRSVQSNASILDSFDLAVIEEMDPSLSEGHRVCFDRECPFELRVQDDDTGPQDVGTLEAIKCKILILGDGQNPQHCRIELTSENDLFFHYTHGLDEHGFQKMQEHQKLMIDFPDYISVVIKMLNNCIKAPHSYLAVYVMQKDGHARLDFIQNMEYKFVELMSCDFVASPEEVVRQLITFRSSSVRSKLALMQARLQDITQFLKVKSPSLLLQLQKTGTRVGLKR
jgi:hypothetical protein